jgi:SAM-dependent methyltransferase
MWSKMTKTASRTTFGSDPASYDAARPEYPAKLYALLERRCGLGPGSRVFEIGAGTGIATRGLLARGAPHVTVVEPDARLARYLRGSIGADRAKVAILPTYFEPARQPAGSFDLGVSATAFHWLEERRALRKIARWLRPGGWWACWWNAFGDPDRPTAFQRALDPLFRTMPMSPRTQLPRKRVPPQLDRRARERALRAVGEFRNVSSEVLRWTQTLDGAHLAALYGTYSPIAILPPYHREWFLGEVARIADEEFGGRVAMRVLTPIYTAQRRGRRLRLAG